MENGNGLSDQQYQLLEELFMGQFGNDTRANPRMRKCESLYALAKVANGPIVELGTYHGCGAVSLYWGAQAGTKQPVITCDPFQDSYGWIGEPYRATDIDVFFSNMNRCGAKSIRLMMMDADTLFQYWKTKNPWIGLLFWDIGGTRLFDDYLIWHSYILPGGVFAIHDTGNFSFGYSRVRALAYASGSWDVLEPMPGFVYPLRRTM